MPDTIFTTPKCNDRLARLWEDLLADPVPPRPAAAQWRTVAARFDEMDELKEAERRQPVLISQDEPVSRSWRVNLATWLYRLVELEDATSVLPSSDEASLASPSPFRWEPKAAWIGAPLRSNPRFSNTTDPRHIAPRPKIPIRPLHKQAFYRRFFFYLHRWLSSLA